MKTLEDKEKELTKAHGATEKKSMDSLAILKDRLAQLKGIANDDCKEFDESSVQTELAELSRKIAKWINRRSDFQFKKEDHYMKMMEVRRELFEFYKKDYPLKFDNKDEMNLFIDSDSRYQYRYQLYRQIGVMIDFCEYVIKNLNSKQYALQNYQKERSWREGN